LLAPFLEGSHWLECFFGEDSNFERRIGLNPDLQDRTLARGMRVKKTGHKIASPDLRFVRALGDFSQREFDNCEGSLEI